MLSAYRAAVLGVAGLEPVERLLRRHGMRLGARRFVAGHDVAEATGALQTLLAEGKSVIVDVLGEYVTEPERAVAARDAILATVDALADAGIQPVISVKPTQLGLAIRESVAVDLARSVASRAEARGGRVALDMEDARYTDGTLRLLRALWSAGFAHSSSVLQAYLHRTPDDLEALLADAPTSTTMELRIVKGAYHEPAAIAARDLPTIRRRFVALVERAWSAGAKVNVATHDERIIAELAAFARGAALGGERLEFQLLYGVKPRLQAELVRAGHAVRIYVPIGHDWYGYFSRRLAERPANLALVARGLAG